jgi:hypothetical protein
MALSGKTNITKREVFMAKQLTIFMENRPGRINSVCDVLQERG